MIAEELMVGDWVSLFQGKKDGQSCNVKVTFINDEEIGVDSEECDYTSALPCLLFPIPLTPEILEKNGFVGEDKVHYSFCGTDNILELLENETPFGIDGFDIVRTHKGINENKQSYYIDHCFASIYNVHELQHALRLCGIDKEIILKEAEK